MQVPGALDLTRAGILREKIARGACIRKHVNIMTGQEIKVSKKEVRPR